MQPEEMCSLDAVEAFVYYTGNMARAGFSTWPGLESRDASRFTRRAPARRSHLPRALWRISPRWTLFVQDPRPARVWIETHVFPGYFA